MLLVPLYFQAVRGASALQAGLLMAPGGMGAMLTTPIAGRLTRRHAEPDDRVVAHMAPLVEISLRVRCDSAELGRKCTVTVLSLGCR
jgi:hypothetical protein